MGVGYGEECPLPIGGEAWEGAVLPPQKNFSFLSLKIHILVQSECLFLHCNTSRSRPPVRLPTLTFQADRGSIKGAGVSAEEGTELYLPWWRIHENLIVANVETLSHDDSYSYSFSSDGHQFGGHGPLASLWIRHWS